MVGEHVDIYHALCLVKHHKRIENELASKFLMFHIYEVMCLFYKYGH